LYTVWDISSRTAKLRFAFPRNWDWSGDDVLILWSPDGKFLCTYGVPFNFRGLLDQAFIGFAAPKRASDDLFTGLRFCSLGNNLEALTTALKMRWTDKADFPHDNGLLAAAFSPDGQHVVTISKTNGTEVWDVRTGSLVATLKMPGKQTDWEYETFQSKALFSPNKRILLTCQRKSHVQTQSLTWALWDTSSWGLIETWEPPIGDEVALSPDGSHFVGVANSEGDSNTVLLWRLPERTERLRIRTLRPEQLYFSGDGKQLITSPRFADSDNDYRNNVNVWDMETGNLKARITDRYTTASSISPDGSTLVTGNNTGDLSIWRLSDAKLGPYRSEYPISGITQSQFSELRLGMLFRQIRTSLGPPDESKTIEVKVKDTAGNMSTVQLGVCIYYADLSTGANAALILQGGTYGSLVAKHSVGL